MDTPTVPPRDPERPQDDPWDSDAIRYLLGTPDGANWTRGNLMECLRAQDRRLETQPDKVGEAIALGNRHGVERRPDPDGKTIHFFRTDSNAPSPYPASANERRELLRSSPN